jgi:hypothetical protein
MSFRQLINYEMKLSIKDLRNYTLKHKNNSLTLYQVTMNLQNHSCVYLTLTII